MDAPSHSEQAGEGKSARAVASVVHGAVQRRRDLGAGGVGHGLGADHERGVALAGGDGETSVAKGDAARGAGALHLSAGHVRQSELVGDEAGEHLLAVQRPGDEVAQINRADLVSVQLRIVERLCAGFDGERTRSAGPRVAEGGGADAE